MTEKTLRALAKDYANGVLDKDAYRKARDTLICGILSGDTPVVANEFRPPMQAQDLNSTFDKTAIQMVAPPREKEPKPTTEFVPPPPKSDVIAETKTRESSLKLYILPGVVVAAIAIFILTLVLSLPDETTLLATDNSDVLTPVEQTTIAEQNIPASELIEGFLNSHDWSEEQLQQFISRWNNLTPDELAKGLTPPLSIRLANAIYKQLLEERSLFGTGNDDAIIARQQTLVDFAEGLGMDDPRLQVREAPPVPANESEPVIQVTPDIAPTANEESAQ
jgi:hypothetical protein